jgi:hypothetical protein
MTHLYDLAPWELFFVAEVGAAAALTGLLFVAVSNNLDRILQYPKLPARAAETLVLLLLVVTVASLALAPQTTTLFGWELVAVSSVVMATTLTVQLRHGPDSSEDPTWWFASRIGIAQLPVLCFLVGGISLVAELGGGLLWTVPGVLLAFVGAVYNAWVLLVEIVRNKPAA